MKTILIPTDFSTNSAHAAKYAGKIANVLNANVVLLNIYKVPDISEFQLSSEFQYFIDRARNESEKQLMIFKDSFLKWSFLHPNSVSIRLESGIVPKTINEIAQEVSADIIIMGTKGTGNLLDKWVGTVAKKVMKEAKCKVLVVPVDCPILFPKELVYAADYKDDEIEATHKVIDFAKSIDANCMIIHIHEENALDTKARNKKIAQSLKEEFKGDNVAVQNLNSMDTIEGLEQYLINHKPDLLILGKENKSVLERILNKSVTNYFVQNSNVPILIFQKW